MREPRISTVTLFGPRTATAPTAAGGFIQLPGTEYRTFPGSLEQFHEWQEHLRQDNLAKEAAARLARQDAKRAKAAAEEGVCVPPLMSRAEISKLERCPSFEFLDDIEPFPLSSEFFNEDTRVVCDTWLSPADLVMAGAPATAIQPWSELRNSLPLYNAIDPNPRGAVDGAAPKRKVICCEFFLDTRVRSRIAYIRSKHEAADLVSVILLDDKVQCLFRIERMSARAQRSFAETYRWLHGNLATLQTFFVALPNAPLPNASPILEGHVANKLRSLGLDVHSRMPAKATLVYLAKP